MASVRLHRRSGCRSGGQTERVGDNECMQRRPRGHYSAHACDSTWRSEEKRVIEAEKRGRLGACSSVLLRQRISAHIQDWLRLQTTMFPRYCRTTSSQFLAHACIAAASLPKVLNELVVFALRVRVVLLDGLLIPVRAPVLLPTSFIRKRSPQSRLCARVDGCR